ncbi:serine/threonine protein kinase [Trichocoleus sp. DQ-U1]|uniref:serine/threonine protein kinase n=1 Tax=Trichocoleus sp. DQ-U1 TaxID=2933926 RepID=UPI003297D58A
MIGRLLDQRYQVVQALGAGGFGKTYIAKDTRRPGAPTCVVKHLKPASSDPHFLETARRLFTSEAETLEQLGNHDQIPRLLANFEENQEFYLVQEFIDGHPLSAELSPSYRWEEGQVIQMLQQVLSVLEFVHYNGVIHRDIKPDNLIRRNSDSKLVLVDFGAVKLLRTQTLINQAQASATVAIGTPGYMPTEQAQGRPRPNSDIYALGMIGIQALTGLMPLQLHEDPQTGEILWQHLVAVSPGLAGFLTKMTRYHFKDRYQSATEALQELQQLIYGSRQPGVGVGYPPIEYAPSPPAPPTPPSEQKTLPVVPPQPTPQPTQQPISQEYNPPVVAPSSNKFPLAMGIGVAILVFAVGGAIALYQSQPKSNGGSKSNPNEVVDKVQETCKVSDGPLNVRSSPNASVVGSVKQGTILSVTGTARNGWVPISSPLKGWVFRKYIDCGSSASTPTKPTPTTTAKPSPETPKPTVDRGREIISQATEKFQAGDFDGAIALVRSIPANSSAYGQAREALQEWSLNWSVAQGIYRDSQRAFEQGRWQDVIAAANDPGLPQIRYWQDRLRQLAAQAEQKQNEQTPSPSPSESPSESPSPTESPSPIQSPSESPSPTESPATEPSL